MGQTQASRAAIGAWASYDVANTVFLTGIVGLTFPLWITKEMSGNDGTFGYTMAAASAVVLLGAPFVGAVSDQLGRRLPLLLVATLLGVASTLLLGTGGLMAALILLSVAIVTVELGIVLYNSLLTEVSTEANRGTIVGLGTGVGYLGAFLAVGIALIFTETRGYEFVFRAIALAYLLFTLPLFIFLKERGRRGGRLSAMHIAGQAISQIKGNLGNLPRYPGLRTYLLGRLVYTVGIHTVTVFAVLYASETVELSDKEIQLILLAGISVAVPAALVCGVLVDRVGPIAVLKAALLVWVVLLLLAVGVPWLGLPLELWWLVGCLTGVAIPGVFTADRPLMAAFAPPQYVGEFFGMYGLVGKMGRVIGPFMWAFIVDALNFSQPVAMSSMLVCIVISYGILARLHEPAKSPMPHPAG